MPIRVMPILSNVRELSISTDDSSCVLSQPMCVMCAENSASRDGQRSQIGVNDRKESVFEAFYGDWHGPCLSGCSGIAKTAEIQILLTFNLRIRFSSSSFTQCDKAFYAWMNRRTDTPGGRVDGRSVHRPPEG